MKAKLELLQLCHKTSFSTVVRRVIRVITTLAQVNVWQIFQPTVKTDGYLFYI